MEEKVRRGEVVEMEEGRGMKRKEKEDRGERQGIEGEHVEVAAAVCAIRHMTCETSRPLLHQTALHYSAMVCTTACHGITVHYG